ncbi:MAG: class I SAM-dependent DNA methyltransferase [Spirosomaceae bacterium]|jgi:hypothetical protein|nr:class I SAM-dependent DNA methyltransferase [Spirosomataceae bacterium]
MNIAQIEANLQTLVGSLQPDTFVYDLLLAYDTPRSSIVRLQKGGLNLAKNEGELAWKKKFFFKTTQNEDLHALISGLRNDARVTKLDPRFIVVTDFQTLLALDRKTTDTLDIPLSDLPRHFDFFLPWAGMEKTQYQNENPADVKAAERMARLYDEIRKENPELTTPEAVHSLNVFLSRLLFCYFAEDTGIFEKGQFTNAIASHTQPDGSDLHTYLDRLFEVLNTPRNPQGLLAPPLLKGEGAGDAPSHGEVALPAYLAAFPYVNGGLFRERHYAPRFGRRSRQMAIEAGELDWSAINPDIFGSMIQAVVTPEHRGGMGMHYTSVPNIMKVIEPLFLDELCQSYEASKFDPRKLQKLLDRLARIKIFDPACGSGNFLIIAYKELRKLETKIHHRFLYLQQLATKKDPDQLELDLIPKEQIRTIISYQFNLFSGIALTQFYGIELDDFAHEIALLSLWLAEHQMNKSFENEFGIRKASLPLNPSGHIVHGNATRLDWEAVCPKRDGDEIYILGNPPYLGSSLQSPQQKEDMALVFKGIEGYKNLDYIACWFLKGADYIRNHNAQFAFVSTNSICQGEQVALLWPHLFRRNVEIGFAQTSFKWVNNAKANAGVTVIIVGVRNEQLKTPKYLFSENRKVLVTNINAYLAQGRNVVIEKKNEPLSNFSKMLYGSKPVDGGHLILTTEEKNEFVITYPESDKFIKKLSGSEEFINGLERWCLWITDDLAEEALSIDWIKSRVERVRQMRLNSSKVTTREDAKVAYAFGEIRFKQTNSIILPSHSSENRQYIPIGFLDEKTVISNSAFAIYDAEPWLFSVLTSRMHMTWVRAVCGSLETRIRYSSTLGYNTFPFPVLSERQRAELEECTWRIIDEREYHSEKTLAQLYDPDKMPEGLRQAHRANDAAVERLYRSRLFETDEERLEYLFKLYEQMLAEEKSRGTLFEKEKKTRKR